MALRKLEPDYERVEELALRIKTLTEATALRSWFLNERENTEIAAARQEIEDMGLCVTVKRNIIPNSEDPTRFNVEAEVDVGIPKNTTLH